MGGNIGRAVEYGRRGLGVTEAPRRPPVETARRRAVVLALVGAVAFGNVRCGGSEPTSTPAQDAARCNPDERDCDAGTEDGGRRDARVDATDARGDVADARVDSRVPQPTQTCSAVTRAPAVLTCDNINVIVRGVRVNEAVPFAFSYKENATRFYVQAHQVEGNRFGIAVRGTNEDGSCQVVVESPRLRFSGGRVSGGVEAGVPWLVHVADGSEGIVWAMYVMPQNLRLAQSGSGAPNTVFDVQLTMMSDLAPDGGLPEGKEVGHCN